MVALFHSSLIYREGYRETTTKPPREREGERERHGERDGNHQPITLPRYKVCVVDGWFILRAVRTGVGGSVLLRLGLMVVSVSVLRREIERERERE